MIGMAVIGSSGHAARVAAPTIARAPGVRLVGVLGSSPERGAALAGRHPGSRAYPDLNRLLADPEAEAVWIAGPNHCHAEHATACLQAGKHVLLEKPLATTTLQAAQLVSLADTGGKVLIVGFQHRFRPGHRWLREAIAAQRFGAIGLLRIHRCWPFPYFPDMPADPRRSWRSSPECSGGWALNDIGAHLIDLGAWILGEPLGFVAARTTNLRFTEARAEDTAVVVLEAEPRVTVVIETSNAMASFPGTIEVHGTAGWARADGTFDAGGTIVTEGGDDPELPPTTAEQVSDAQLADFLGAVKGAPARGATARQAADTVAIVEAAVRDRTATTAGRT